jgi:alpha-L-rhamnosidase
MVELRDLRAEHLVEPLGLHTGRPRFSWQFSADQPNILQSWYELEVRRDSDAEPIWRSGRVTSADSVLVRYDGPELDSATRYLWRVRCGYGDAATGWAESYFETGLLRRPDWVADFVEPLQVPVTADGLTRENGDWAPPQHDGPPQARLHPAQYLRQAFALPDRPARARLYATAHGVYAAEVNGRAVGDQVLAPGYESYDQYLSFQTYDVTALLQRGPNVLGVVLGDGWYAGRISFTGTSAQYGDHLRAGWQLEITFADGDRRVITPDEAVVSSADGAIRYSDIFIGERHDARCVLQGWSAPGFDDSTWTPVRVVPAPTALVPFVGEPVRRALELPAREILTTPDGDTVIDFGQVIAGRVRMKVRGPAGTEVRLEHTEVLDRDGNFFINVEGVNKDQTDFYVLSGDPEGEEWEPAFTYHGFRYVRLTGYPGRPSAGAFRAIVLASDLEATASFDCSDARITRLHRNAVWSQRGNFLAVPTDCPQRERAGWTGDLQIFAPTASTNMRVISFLTRWLTNVRADQLEDGTIPVIVPAVPVFRQLADDLADDPLLSIRAAAGWGDAVVVVPSVLHERYGDTRVLAENYDAMQRWVERQIRVAADQLPKRLRSQPLDEEQMSRQRLLWNSEPTFGDWLAPSVTARATSLDDLLAAAELPGELIAAMFHGYSAELLGQAADALGRQADAERYRRRAADVRDAFAEEYLDGSGNLLVRSQGVYVLALALGFVPADQRAAAVDHLVELVHAADDHLDTGFLSVPYLLDALWENGRQELARTLLWQSSSPSWLYAVDRGATTMWEKWDAIRPDGAVTVGSFNHYAFGCVDDWLFRRLAGIQAAAPGYRISRIEPDLDAPLEWVDAHHDSAYGRLAVRWERDPACPSRITVRVTVPANTMSSIVLPSRAQQISVDPPADLERLGSGSVTVTCELPVVDHHPPTVQGGDHDRAVRRVASP